MGMPDKLKEGSDEYLCRYLQTSYTFKEPNPTYKYFRMQFQISLISAWTWMSEMINVYKTAAEPEEEEEDSGVTESDSFIIQAIADVDDLLAVRRAHAIKRRL